VSPLWPNPFANQLLVGINQQQLSLLQIAVLGKRVLQHQHVMLNGKLESGWSSALEKFQLMLSNNSLQKSKVMRVVLASEFVRYLALPAHHSVMNYSDKIDFARAAYREIYGNVADTWLIQCDDAAPNYSSIAVAIDQNLVDELSKIAVQHGMQLRNLQPFLMPVFNTFKNKLTKGLVYLAVIESSRLLFASLNNGHWQSIHSFSLEADWLVQLSQIAKRESMTSESKINRVLMVYAPSDKSASLPQLTGWNLQRIGIQTQKIPNQNRGQEQSQHYAMLETLI
jgi:hypothetical protein